MRKIYTVAVILFCILTSSVSVFAQNADYWTANNESRMNIVKDKSTARQSFPVEFKLFNLNISPLKQRLFSVTGNRAASHSTVISLPNAEGAMEQFEVFEASNFEPALQARFPEIRAYSGKGITDKSAMLKLSISPQGIQTMIFRTDKANEFIEAYSQDHTVYAVFRSQRNKGQYTWTCSTQEQEMVNGLNNHVYQTNRPMANTGELKTMRLAQSCNGEYANYFGATSAAQVGLVLAAYNATLTRCNGVYEKDLALHLNLIANTTDVIYYVPATDPYTTLANWNLQLQQTLTAIIGSANYDIGHMFGASGGGGNAGCIGCVCVDPATSTSLAKGAGITSPADGIPQGDNFDIDYVAHEVGHQIGGNHTFSMSIEAGGANNVEVGSGITIMGYAGITAQDVAPHSIDIFSQRSIQQIQNNLATKTCPITTNIMANNATPVVTTTGNFTIPISTPFQLTGVATDANPGDVLTYCWEQNDNANSTVTGANSVAIPTKLVGPNWLSFPATTSPTRLFPKLSTILAGLFITPVLPGGDAGANIEALSSVSRTLNFRLTVRDNALYSSNPPVTVGQTGLTNTTVTVTNTSGPFMVTQPNTNLSWPAASAQTVTWNVAGTTGAPVSCSDVKITMSIDGGQTFPFVLAASTPNDGSELINLPSVAANTTSRVKIESIGNIFFDISNTNFTITVAASSFIFNPTTASTSGCNGPSTAAITLGTTASSGFSTPINLSAISGVPAGTTVSFSVNPLTPGNSTVVTLNNVNTLSNGTYNISIQGVAGAVTQTSILTFIVSAGVSPVITSQPTAVSVITGSPASFSVTATGATNYQWQVNAGAGYTNIAGANAATYSIPSVTSTQDGYLYQCIVIGQCNSTTSNAAMLTVQSAPAIVTQPASISVCTGSNHTFSVTATGSGLSYQWQISTTGCAGPWTDIAGAMASSYSLTGITLGMNNTGYRCVVSGAFTPSLISDCALLNVGSAAAITGEPVNSTVCEGANTSFSATATGAVSYQWQVNTGTGFVNVPGEISPTLNLTAVTASMNGYQYQLNVRSCFALPILSNAVTLTVNTLVSISAQPADAVVCSGANSSFSVTASGTGASYQWQYAASCSGFFSDIPGAMSATLNLTAVTLANAGAYRVVITGTCNTITSTCATLTVNSPVTISAQPMNVDICLPLNSTSFSVTAAGTGLSYQWQVNTGTGFTNITGANAATLNLSGIIASMNGYQYRVVLNGTCTVNLNSTAATLAVNSPVDITSQPQSVSTCAGSAASISVTATGSTITYQWQYSVNGGPFVNVSNTAPFSGVTSSTLNINPINTTLNGYVFRVIVSGVPCGAVTSANATLTANALPVVVLTAASYNNITPYIRTTLYTTVSAPGNYTYQWFRNGVLVPSLTAERFSVTVDDFGIYDVIVTNNATGCSSRKSNTAKIDFAASSELFVYPNPSSGQFQVRYLSYTNNVARTLTIFDSKGAKVFSKQYTTSTPYTAMDVNLDNAASDVYLIELRDQKGKRLATGKVVIK